MYIHLFPPHTPLYSKPHRPRSGVRSGASNISHTRVSRCKQTIRACNDIVQSTAVYYSSIPTIVYYSGYYDMCYSVQTHRTEY